MMNSIIFEIKNNIGFIYFNQPDRLNALDKEMAFSIQKYLDIFEKDDEIRAVFITGKGKGFCAGQFLGELVSENAPSFKEILKDHFNPIITRIQTLRKPVVAAVNGVAAGAGANIALACDIVIATESAKFIQSFTNIGLIPDSGGTFILPRLIGYQKAMALCLLAEPVMANDAEKMGMIYKVFPDNNFEEEALKIVTKLSLMPTLGLGLTKKALLDGCSNNLQQQLALEDELQYIAAHSHDYKEGVQAFLEKRKPLFIGK